MLHLDLQGQGLGEQGKRARERLFSMDKGPKYFSRESPDENKTKSQSLSLAPFLRNLRERKKKIKIK